MFGLHDAKASLQEGDSYVILRYKDGKSDKFYGLLNRDGVCKTNWGRFSATKIIHQQGGQKKVDKMELFNLLDAKVRKGYKVLEIRRCMSKRRESRPEGLEGAYMVMPKDRCPSNKVWGLYDEHYNLISWIPKTVCRDLVLQYGVVITGLNIF